MNARTTINQGDIFWIPPEALPNMKRATEPGNVVLDEGEANLPKQSVAVVSQVSTVEKIELGAYIGTLTAERVQQLLDGLTFQQRSFFDR